MQDDPREPDLSLPRPPGVVFEGNPLHDPFAANVYLAYGRRRGHAGLEYGTIHGKYLDLDMVSIGPTMDQAHSTSEALYVPTMKKVMNLIVETLRRIPTKWGASPSRPAAAVLADAMLGAPQKAKLLILQR